MGIFHTIIRNSHPEIIQKYKPITPFHCLTKAQLDDFSWFVSQANYDSTRSTPWQFPVYHYVIQLDDFNQFFSGSTKPSPRQFSDDH